jgi:hypothetical protein
LQNNSALFAPTLTGTVNANNKSGGIAGNVTTGSQIDSATNDSNHTVNATNVNDIGGIAGYLDATSTLTDVEFAGTITATNSTAVGGIVGYNADGTITNALAAGTFNTSSSTTVGALVGDNSTGTISSINTSFYDTRSFANAVGSGSPGSSIGSNSNLVLQGPDAYLIAGWSISDPAGTTWTSQSGFYPFLSACLTGCSVALPGEVVPTPTQPGFPPGVFAGIQNTIYNAENTNMLDPLPFDVTSVDVTNLADAYTQIVTWLEEQGIPTDFLGEVVFFQTNTIDPNLSSQIAADNDLITLQVIVAALQHYYCAK